MKRSNKVQIVTVFILHVEALEAQDEKVLHDKRWCYHLSAESDRLWCVIS
jgi:hypothetical protein